MLLAIQAFRYAGEPFFFANAENRQAPELFARVMYYFVIVCVFILMAVSLNIHLLGKIFLRQESYREALYLVPVLLLGKLLFGIYINLSVWFKLVDKTLAGTYISLAGAFITILVNYLLIPVIGYAGSALASVACYASMSIICWFWGRKHFPIPYAWGKIIAHLALGIVLIVIVEKTRPENELINLIVNVLTPCLYIGIVALIEKRKLNSKII